MLNRLVLENLKHRPLRTILSILGIGVPVTMILTLVGVSRGMLDSAADRARGVGSDIVIRDAGSSFLSVSPSPIPEKFVGYFEKQPHVAIATGNLVAQIGGIKTLSGIDLPRFSAMSGGFRYLKGGPFERPFDIITDSEYAAQEKLHIGQDIKLLNHHWRVVGIVEPGKLSRVFVPLKTLQDIMSSTGKLMQIYVKVDDPARVDEVLKTLKADPGLADLQIVNMKEFLSVFSVNSVPELKVFIRVIIGLAAVIGFFVVSITMYTAVLERTREIGILKALGATPQFILRMLVRETILLALLGSLAGILLTFIARWAILHYIPASMTQEIVPDWWVYAALISITGALLGSLYPGMKAARQDAIEALSYE